MFMYLFVMYCVVAVAHYWMLTTITTYISASTGDQAVKLVTVETWTLVVTILVVRQ